jgi:pimeloyl-ACP methyl ester carboxylesterase
MDVSGGEAVGGRAPGDTMRTVVSKDGTRIAVWQGGRGQSLLLVHGATADHTTTWRLVRDDLERRYTVHAMDRRGRGGSGDAPAYALQREAEDIAAVVDAIGEPVTVLGHSFGGLCALEAARLTDNMRGLILYEGVPLHGATLYAGDVAERLGALLAAGDVEGMLQAMYRELVGMPDDEIALLRSHEDAWKARLRNAPTLPRELAAEQGYTFQAERFRHLRTPVLLLVGGASPAHELEHARGVAASLPDARIAVMPGQQHVAMYTAPELFVREIVAFMEAGREQ